jgi:lysophospholipase L1-like esterase
MPGEKKKDKKKEGKNVNQFQSPPNRSAGRRWIFTLIMCAIPVLFFVMLETGLRTAGFGQAYPLFISTPEIPDYIHVNPQVIKRYFNDPRDAPSVSSATIYFRTKKSPGTFRIFVQGGSTAAGYPFGVGASLAGMLQQRLQHTFTDRPVEVVSTAMAAVNSYTLLDFADKIISYEPDAILIYVGHNEYVGILGVASTVSMGRSRSLVLAFLKLRDLRTFQLLQKVYIAAGNLFSEGPEQKPLSRGTLMSRIVDEKYIPYGSSLYELGAQQFRANLKALLARYREAGIPVFIGTLVSNERDQKPFISRPGRDTNASEWEEHYQTGVQALEQGDPAAASTALDKAIAIDTISASAYYAQGQLFEVLKDYGAARQAYLLAKDRDQLRFRAPEIFNEIIRDAARQYGMTVVEVRKAFLDKANNGIIGQELMLEHLHPNLEGYFLIADAFYNAIREKGLIGPWDNAISYDQAWKEVPVTEVDNLVGIYQAEYLMHDWPFQPQKVPYNPPEPENYIEELAADLYNLIYYQKEKDYAQAARIAVMLAQAFPFWERPQYIAGQLLVREKRYREAVFYLNRAVDLKPEKKEYLMGLSRAYALNAQKDQAQHSLQRLLDMEPDHKEGKGLLKKLEGSSD